MKWNRKVYDWLLFVREAFYPPLCALCAQPGIADRDLCSGCWYELPRNTPCCQRCALPLQLEGALCGACSRTPPPFERSVIPFRYEPPFDHLLQQLKFHQRLQLAPLLGQLLAEAVAQRSEPLPALLLPVPMHPRRVRRRGYNQALELARRVSVELGIPFSGRLCRRVRHTPAQTTLQGRERRRNLRGAFTVEGSLPRHVAIVDDVVTTGATVQEFARSLRRAGAETIEVWACARAGKD